MSGRIRFKSTGGRIAFEEVESEEEYSVVKIKVSAENGVLSTVKIDWSIPCIGVLSQWNPMLDTNRCLMPDWSPVECRSRSVFGAPIQVHIGGRNENKCTVALADGKIPCKIRSGVYEETAEIRYKLELFFDENLKITEYETELLADRREIPFYDAIDGVRLWWENHGYRNTASPDFVKMPMYSTWYSMHQRLRTDELTEELRVASRYGMKAVIVDDGWQTGNNGRGYAYCGDWQPAESKIPDMRALVDAVHGMGMKYIMWYSVPFVGKNSAAYKKFDGKFLKICEDRWAILDPRCKSVRDYLADIYESAVREWDIDGLKLDFIDSFELPDKDLRTQDMDIISIEDALCALLDEVRERIRAVKPDAVIEFRQNYMGPAMLRYADMMRAADSPCDALRNRIFTVNLRLTSGRCAVHSDMLMWNMQDTPEGAAMQLINVFFAVPQISVRMCELGGAHAEMLAFYLGVWKKYRECILDGKLRAYNPEANYSMVTSETEEEIVVALYSRNYVALNKEYEKIVIINGSSDGSIIFSAPGGDYTANVYNCTGQKCISDMEVKTSFDIIDVPRMGMAELICRGI